MNRTDSRHLAALAMMAWLPIHAYAQQNDAARVEAAPPSVAQPTAITTAREIDPAQFEALFAGIKPAESESKWLEIPWIGTILEGREAAAAASKPFFLWAMNGHPLGTC